MKKVDINCDVGEGLSNEFDLMPYIQSCNIACGGHAGDENSMQKVVALAIKNKVKIGAHPSYPDPGNFGRKTITMKPSELKISIQHQINRLRIIAREQGSNLHHIKPHGALYNDIAKNKELAIHFLEAIKSFKKEIKLYVPYNSVIAKNALKQGFSIEYEAFADRNYNDDLSLVSRLEKNAVITDPEAIWQHMSEMLNNEKVQTVSGKLLPIKATTFCVHSDTQNAAEIVKILYQKTNQ